MMYYLLGCVSGHLNLFSYLIWGSSGRRFKSYQPDWSYRSSEAVFGPSHQSQCDLCAILHQHLPASISTVRIPSWGPLQ